MGTSNNVRLYGNIINRIEEGHNYLSRELKEGDDITMYLWSDRYCYYITEVIDQKHIKVVRYSVCADHDKEIYMGHQNWLYFKTAKEMNTYLSKYDPSRSPYVHEEEEETWVYRNNKWKREFTFTYDNHCTKREKESLSKRGYYKRYAELSGQLSFGVRDYYYDWEF